MSLKKRLLKNGLASGFQKGVRVMEELFLVPFFISAWGAAYYGEWLTLTIIPSVIAFSDLGFGTATGNSFVLSYASGDKQKAADINKTGIYIISLMVFLGLIISLTAVIILNYFKVFDKSLINSQEAIIAVVVLILARLLKFYLQLFQAYYRSAQKAALSINLMTINAAFNLIAGLLVLTLGYGVVEFAISQLLVSLIFNVVYYYKGRQVLGLHKLHKGKKDNTIIKDITTKGLSYLMMPVWQAIYFQGTTFVVRIVLGPTSVALFNTVRTLSRSLNQLFFMLKSTVFPELQYEIGKNNWETAQKVYRMTMLSVLLMSLFGFVVLAIFGLWFYGIWTQNELVLPKSMWYIFISGMVFNALWWTTEMVYGAVNEPYKMAKFGVVSAIISVGLTYVLSSSLGITGAAIGAVSLDFILLLVVVPYGCQLMRMSVKDLFFNGITDFQTLVRQLNSKIQKLK